MKKVFVIAATLALLGLGVVAQAVTIPMVSVGDKGNTADKRYVSSGYGAVAYDYNIGKYEVTAGQYAAFLNAKAATDTYGLYNPSMWTDALGCKIQQIGSSGSYSYSIASDWANRPVNFVSFWDSARFANWLNNGQGTGSTEIGAYTLTTAGITNNTVTRTVGWKWAVTSENEWYKAAYYKGGSTSAGYWDYTTQSNTKPGRDMTDVSGNNANYYTDSNLIGSPYYRTEVGEFQNSDSAYGTFDQGGNVWEWNDAIRTGTNRGRRGGSFDRYTASDSLKASNTYTVLLPAAENGITGFRVTSAVPEPGTILAALALLAPAGLMIRRRRV